MNGNKISPTHYRSRLPAELQPVYRQITASLLRYQYEIVLESYVSPADAAQAAQAVHRDHPELFYVDFWHYRVSASHATGLCRGLIFSPLLPESILPACQNTVANQLTILRSMPDIRSYRKLAAYIATDLEYQETGKENALLCHTMLGPLLRHTAVCEGIPKLFLLYCQQLRLPCCVVPGALHGAPHMWNAVETPTGLRHVDVTGELSRTKRLGSCGPWIFRPGELLRQHGYAWDAADVGF